MNCCFTMSMCISFSLPFANLGKRGRLPSGGAHTFSLDVYHLCEQHTPGSRLCPRPALGPANLFFKESSPVYSSHPQGMKDGFSPRPNVRFMSAASFILVKFCRVSKNHLKPCIFFSTPYKDGAFPFQVVCALPFQ